jgi:acetoin utilization deacetylase AcuC-like enzyme
MLIVASDVHRAHHSLELSNGAVQLSEEGPDRADLIASTLRDAGHDFVTPDPIAVDQLGAIHTADYLDFLGSAWDRWVAGGETSPGAMGFTWPVRGMLATRPDDLIGQLGYHSFSADCSITHATWTAATEAAAIASSAVDRMRATGDVVYGLCRPPGHHATADQFGGYCYINNAAIAAQRLLDTGARRVAVLDVDYHHGNGTQSIFFERSDVLFVSIHADPMFEFPWFAGHAAEIGSGDGDGWNLNLPLPSGTGFAQWRAALDVAMARITDAQADALVVSLGVDIYEHDPLGTFTIATSDFGDIARTIGEAGLATVVVQEGGYAVGDIGANVAAFLEPLA